jgi:hypothetical protein
MKKFSGISDEGLKRVGKVVAQSDFDSNQDYEEKYAETLARCQKLANKLGYNRALRIASDVLARGEVIASLEDCSLEDLQIVEDSLRSELKDIRQNR